jgi:hypothetical protein
MVKGVSSEGNLERFLCPRGRRKRKHGKPWIDVWRRTTWRVAWIGRSRS